MVSLNFNPAGYTYQVRHLSKDAVDTSSTIGCMKRARRWLAWKSVPSDRPNSKPDKVPYYVDGRPRGKTDTPEDLASLVAYDEALAFCEAHPDYALGFALGPDGKGGAWQGFDFDNRLDGIDAAPGYVERSPSGKGYHSIGYGRSFPARNKDGIEAYSSKRFFTVTKDVVNDGPLVDLMATPLRQYLFLLNDDEDVNDGRRQNDLERYINQGNIPEGECDNALIAFHGHAAAAVSRGWASEVEALAFLGRVNTRLPANKDKDFAGKFRRMMEKEGLSVKSEPENYAEFDDGGELSLFKPNREEKGPPPDYWENRAYELGRGASTAIEFVVENFITTGIYALYGPYNSGKTSTILSLLLHVSGCAILPGLPESLRRPVILVSEHPEQVDRLIEGYRQAGVLLAPPEELNRWLKVVPSDRQTGSFWKQALADLAQTYESNHSGEAWWPLPLVVYDTAASNLLQTRVENNAEISDILAGIREGSRGSSRSLPVWIILHTPKAQRYASADDLTALGGQDWGASTVGEVKFTVENDAYLVTLGKRRFEIVPDKDGRVVDQFCIESEVLDPIEVVTPWADYAPALATQQQVRRVVKAFQASSNSATKASRKERQREKAHGELWKTAEEKFVHLLGEAQKNGFGGICIWAVGEKKHDPGREQKIGYIWHGISKFCARTHPSANETDTVREMLAKRFGGERRGELYFFDAVRAPFPVG